MQSPHPPPAPVGPHARYAPNQHLFQGPGGLVPPAQGGLGPQQMMVPSHSPNLMPPPPTSQAMRPYSAGSRPHSGGPPPTGSAAGMRPYSAGQHAGMQQHPGMTPGMASSVYPPTPQMPGAGRGRPKKRLVVCCDGTWLDSDNGLTHHKIQLVSNVTRISRAVKAESSDGVSQVVYYQAGVGTEGGAISRAVGGATAEGLSSNIREAYSFLAHNWAPGDEIFLIGFSRGAFTARSIAGLISAVGLLTKKGIDHLAVVFKDVEHQHDQAYESVYPDLPFPNKPSAGDPQYALELQRQGLSRTKIPIKAIAVWDTVGSLGIPRVPWLERLGLQRREVKEFTFYDTSLSDNVENAFQALALDEQRSSFVPTIWEKPRSKANMTNLRQVWFPGVHSNVGGGYADLDLSNITLAWMMAQLESMLEFNPDYLREQFRASLDHYAHDDQDPRPWSFGRIYRSMTGVYQLAGRAVRTPGLYPRLDPASGLPTRAPGKLLRDTHEYIHPSVRARLELAGPGVEDRGEYECKALANYRLKLTGAPPGSSEPVATWEARKGGRVKGKKAPRKVLLESPLFETEIRLLEGSPWVQNYLYGKGAGGRGSGGAGAGMAAGGRMGPGGGRGHGSRDERNLTSPVVAEQGRREPGPKARRRRERSRSRAGGEDSDE